VVAVAGVFVAAGALLGGLYAAGVFDEPARPTAGAGAPGAPGTGRPFASLDKKQIRARIEAASYKVLIEHDSEDATATTWVLAGMTGCFVQVAHLHDLKAAMAMEQSQLKQPGATTRDGTSVLHVHIPQTAQAKALLAQIAH
jgi:hypothetical protein